MTGVKIKQGSRVARITETRINQAGKTLYKVEWSDRVAMSAWATSEELYSCNPIEVVNDALAGYHKRPAWEGEFKTFVQGLVTELVQAPAQPEPEAGALTIVPVYRPAFVVNPYSIMVIPDAA